MKVVEARVHINRWVGNWNSLSDKSVDYVETELTPPVKRFNRLHIPHYSLFHGEFGDFFAIFLFHL